MTYLCEKSYDTFISRFLAISKVLNKYGVEFSDIIRNFDIDLALYLEGDENGKYT